MIRRSIGIVTAILFGAPSAMAWGPEGHAVIADVAAAHLTPAARTRVGELLAIEGAAGLDDVSSWADAVRHDRPETAPWHFVDIPLDAPGYDPARDCDADDCVVAQIARFADVLGNAAEPPAARVEALKWVVHLVGDIHQPLHAENDSDKGGNKVRVDFFGRSANLHAVWDGGILERETGLALGPHFSFDHAAVAAEAVKLDGEIAAGDAALWQASPAGIGPAGGGVAAAGWANESHELARRVAYGDLAADRAIGPDYERAAWPVVRLQLERAGIRLAAVLNAELR